MAGRVQIFVSHSSRDPNLKLFLKAFAVTHVKAEVVKFENIITLPWWKTIKEKVAASVATFVLLSKPLEKLKHTQDWIDFEVGLSCAEDKQVWVFEPQGQEIKFLVPYCTYYCIYDPTEPYDAEVKRLKWYIEMYAGETSSKTLWTAPSVTCPRDDCLLEFRVMSNVDSFRCPSCRKPLLWNRQTGQTTPAQA